MSCKKFSVREIVLALVAALLVVLMLTFVATVARSREVRTTNFSEDGLSSVYGHVSICGENVIEVESLDVSMEGDRITDWQLSSQLFGLGYYSTDVTDADGNPLSRSSLTDVKNGVHPHTVTVWYDADNPGDEAPRLIKAVAVRVESVEP